MRSSAAFVVVALLAFGLGWWTGNAGGNRDARLAALEGRFEQLAARQVPGAVPAAQPRPPAAPAPIDPSRIRLDGAPSRGPDDASVVLVEFSDFECPFCLRANPTLDRIRQEYPDDVRVVFKHFPLGFHKNAINAHRAVLAAGEQGQFWEMHDLIFQSPRKLDAKTMRAHAGELGLDLGAFDSAFVSERLGDAIDRDLAEGRELGVRGTPAFFINGRMISGAQPYEVFKRSVDEALAAT